MRSERGAALNTCHRPPPYDARASAEESQSHLRAALLLEGSAHAYLRSDPPMPRKYAIHSVLAGHRQEGGPFTPRVKSIHIHLSSFSWFFTGCIKRDFTLGEAGS